MENKKKKMLIFASIIIVVIIAIVACILFYKKSDKGPNQPNQNETNENNKPNNDENNSSSSEKPGNNNDGNNNDNNNNNNGNNNNDNPDQSGDNNSSNGNPGGTTGPATKKLRIYSCRRTTQDNGIEITDNLNLKYHIEEGLQSDEVIVTIKAINDTGGDNVKSLIEFYKTWLQQLNELKGITVTSTKSGDKTVFSIKTDYTKVDYSNINFEDENRVQFYNDIRANDSLEIITTFLAEAGYTCQPPKEA